MTTESAGPARGAAGGAARGAARWGAGGLLLAGILALAANMRAAITSLPPLFPDLHGALGLSPAGQAALAAIPVLCFGVCSGAGVPLARRFGEERVLGAALVLLAIGLALRGAAPGALLFPGTAAAGAAIALLNVLLPSLVKRRRPDRAGLLIGLYLLSLSVGAIIASLIAVPVYQSAAGGAVRLSLGLWAIPALVAAALWLPQLRYKTEPAPPGIDGTALDGRAVDGRAVDGRAVDGRAFDGRAFDGRAVDGRAVEDRAAAGRSGPGPASGLRRGRSVLWHSALAWQVTAFMGLQSLSYYAALSWLPTLFRDRGASAVHAGTLLALMGLGNAVTASLVPLAAHRLPDQRLLAAIWMVVTGAGLAGAGFAPMGAAAAFSFVLGLGQGASLGLGIFYTVARAPDPVTAASLSAFAQSLGYLVATTGPLLLGLLHSVTGGWAIPVAALLGVVALQLGTGWLAGRARTVPSVAIAGAAGPSATAPT